MRHLAYNEIKNHTLSFSLSNSTPKVAHFLTTIFGSIYHDREQICISRLLKAHLTISLYVWEDMLLHHLKIFLHLTRAVYNVHVAWEERLYIEL